MTFNLNGRPPGIGAALSGNDVKSDQGEPAGGFGACETTHHLATSAMARGRGFLRWLDGLPADMVPQALCLQELMYLPLAELVSVGLERRGYKTLEPVDPRQDGGCPGGSFGCPIPQTGSGLAIFVLASAGLNMLDGGGFAFDNRAGVDRLARKGFRWSVVRIRSARLLGYPIDGLFGETDRRCGVMLLSTVHPMAYMPLKSPGPLAKATEGNLGARLREMANAEFAALGGYPLAISRIHQLQFTEVADHLRDVALPAVMKTGLRFIGAFIAGDFNVNRYAVKPGSADESDADKANQGISNEFRSTMRSIGAVAPQIVAEPRGSVYDTGDGRYSWNGLLNSCARPITPLEKPALGWIDYVVFLKPGTGIWSDFLSTTVPPIRADNRALKAVLDPAVPELAPLFGSATCASIRSLAMRMPSTAGTEDDRSDERNWRKEYAVLNRLRNVRLSKGQNGDPNQIWSSAAAVSVGLLPDDPDAGFADGVRSGQPHAFRWFTDVSDHHPVLGRFVLPLMPVKTV